MEGLVVTDMHTGKVTYRIEKRDKDKEEDAFRRMYFINLEGEIS